MSSSGYIKMLDTVVTFHEAIWPVSQNLCRYSESYTFLKIGVTPKVSN
jgi:hypothetical protein